MVYAFVDCRLDLDRRELRRGGALIDLEPQGVRSAGLSGAPPRAGGQQGRSLSRAVWNRRVCFPIPCLPRGSTRCAEPSATTAQRNGLSAPSPARGVRFIGEVTESGTGTRPDAVGAALGRAGPTRRASGSGRAAVDRGVAVPEHERRPGAGIFRRRHGRGDHHRDRALSLAVRDRAQFQLHVQGQGGRREGGGARVGRALRARRLGQKGRQPGAHHRPVDRTATTRISGATASTAPSTTSSNCRTRSQRRRRRDRTRLRLAEIERASRKPTESLDAYDLDLRAMAQINKRTSEGHAEAVRLAHQALELDPAYAPAMARIAECRLVQLTRHWIPAAGPEVDEGIRMARQAIAAGRDDPWVLRLAGICPRGTSPARTKLRWAALDRAIDLNPNYAVAYAQRALVLALAQPARRGDPAAERAIRLSPQNPNASFFTRRWPRPLGCRPL